MSLAFRIGCVCAWLTVNSREIFGPVLLLISVKDVDEALELVQTM